MPKNKLSISGLPLYIPASPEPPTPVPTVVFRTVSVRDAATEAVARRALRDATGPGYIATVLHVRPDGYWEFKLEPRS